MSPVRNIHEQSRDESLYRRLYLMGFAGYAGLFILSVIFYKERTVFTDIALHLFVLLKNNDFVPNLRFGAFLTQIYPLFASRLGCSLNTVMMSYSVGFVFYHFIYYLLCGFVLKQYRYALVLLLFNLLITSHTFFWMQSEFPQGINLLILSLAIAGSMGEELVSTFRLPALFICIFMVAFMHPLIIFSFGFAFLYLLLQSGSAANAPARKVLWSTGIFFLAVYMVKALFFKAQYDAQSIDNSVASISLSGFWNSYTNQAFLSNCISKYYWLLIMLPVTVVIYITKREWLKLMLVMSFSIGYLFLVNVTHPGSYTPEFYMENLYQSLGFFLAFPIIFDLIPLLQPKALKYKFVPAYAIVFLIMLTGCLRIYTSNGLYTERLEWERDFLKGHPGEKLVLSEQNAPMDKLIMSFGTPYEFWLLSTTEQHRTASIIVMNSTQGVDNILNEKKLFFTTWENFPYSVLPKHYFIGLDTTVGYSRYRPAQ